MFPYQLLTHFDSFQHVAKGNSYCKVSKNDINAFTSVKHVPTFLDLLENFVKRLIHVYK